jgi:tripartite motif-containing protein 71
MANEHGRRSSQRRTVRRGLGGARWARRAICLLAFAVAALASVLPQASAAGGVGFSFTPSKTEPYAVCGRATAGHAACLAILVPSTSALSSSGVLRAASPTIASSPFSGSGVGGGYDPADLRAAYDLPTESAGSGQTVAIVDAFDDPNAESDLSTYRSRYGLPPCTTGGGCFRKVNQTGGTSYPAANASWAVEMSLDLDMVSAACPNCHVLLVEASSNENGNLETAEDEAVALGATEVSNSWGGPEASGEASDDPIFHHPGVIITASAGDSGYEVEYPAASQYVIAVGGTKLTQASNSRGWTETAWNGTGSGCSAFEPKPTWQTASPACTKRTNNDVSAVASAETPVSVADSYKLPSEFSKPEAGWTLVAGTSVSSPFIAGTMALANAYTKSFPGADALYKEASQNGTGVLDDVTSGNNVKKETKSCGNYLCEAAPGYDGPTGLGSPYGAPLVLPNAPTVVTKNASAVAQVSATLNATVNPNEGEVSKCELEYGTTASYGSIAACSALPGSGGSPVAVSASVTGLAGGTTYHFRISATNAGGTSKAADETFKTLQSCTAEGFCASFGPPANIEGGLKEPEAVAVDPSGNVFVADSGHDRVLEFNSKREYLRQFGSAGTGEGQFEGIAGIASNSAGDVYVTGSDRVQEFSPTGAFIRKFGSPGSGNGQFAGPSGVAIDSSGDVWVLDSFNYRVQEFSATGEFLSKFGSQGTGNGQLEAAYGLAISSGNLYVAEFANNRIQAFSTSGTYVGQVGTSGTGNVQFHGPWGIASDPTTGNLYVADLANSRIQELSSSGTFIAAIGSAGSGAGQLSAPRGVAVGSTGNLFIADSANNRISEWTAAKVAGQPPTFAASFTPANIEGAFKEPEAVAVDPSGNIFVADSGHDRVLEFNSTREYLKQFGSEGSGEGQFQGIAGIAANSAGDVYVTGSDRVQEFSPTGAFIRKFGSPGSGNGQFAGPSGIAIDSSGNVWVLDSFNYRVQEFSATGEFLSKFGSQGTGNGQLQASYGLVISGGNLYISEFANNRVQEFSTSGTFIGQFGSSGSGNGQFHGPWGIASDPTTGNLYVADLANSRIQELSSSGTFITTFGSAGSGAGQLSGPRAVAVGSGGVVYVTDTGNSRMEEWLLP